MKKIIMVVLDGFGYRIEEYGNAVQKAAMPNYDMLWNKYPHSLLGASEEAVGLPVGQIGGSEVGHMTIGAGRVVKQELLKIDEYFADGKVESNFNYEDMINYVKDNHSRLHIMGLLSDGGVHSHINHLKSLIELVKKSGIQKCYLHLIGDGRDTDRQCIIKYLTEINKVIKNNPIFSIASICGRYYAMDRDNRWDRTKIYYELITRGTGYTSLDYEKTINSCYKKNVSDEYLPPILVDPEGIIKDRDALMWFNFREDRARQILTSLKDETFNGFITKKMPNLMLYSFYEINKPSVTKPLFEREVITNSLGKYLSEFGLTQARIAETEKFAHVTYFFDGLYKGNIENCDRYLIPSPKVATYDKMPEMSAVEVTKRALQAMNKDYDFILVNYANPDMVGHTGNLEAAIKGLETVDTCLGELIESANMNFYTMFLLSDHGNCDEMLNEKGEVLTNHSLARVPFIVTDESIDLVDGTLASVAPSLLKYLDIKVPDEMKDTEIIIKNKE